MVLILPSVMMPAKIFVQRGKRGFGRRVLEPDDEQIFHEAAGMKNSGRSARWFFTASSVLSVI